LSVAPTGSTPRDEERGTPDGEPRVLMLGMGWFPDTPGGLNRYYRSLFEQLPQASGVVIGPAEDAPSSISARGVPSTPLPRRLLTFWRAARAAAALGTDVLDAHFALYAAAPVLFGRPPGPVVFHFHGPWAQESVARGDGSRLRLALRAGLEKRVVRRADAHVVLSSAFRRELVERYRVSPWEVHVFAPGVDLASFHPDGRPEARDALDIGAGAFVGVCVRRLVPRMGIESLLAAWGRALRHLPSGSTLMIAGDGPLRESLEREARRPGLHGSVRILGRVSEQELGAAYRAADVAVVPTAALEGFGLVVLEAAASGTPTIATDVGGLPEVLGPLDPSLIVRAGDDGALADRIVAAAGGQLPARAQTRRYAESFSWPALAERHRSLYRRLLVGRRDERLRVVYLDHVARLSGGEIALMRVLTHLRGVQPHVILGEEGPLADRLQQAGISVEVMPIASAARDVRRADVRLGAPPSAAAGLHTAAYIAKLARRLRSLSPDIVHTNSLKSGIYGSIAAKAADIPVVWHVRDRIAEDYIPRGAVRVVRTMVTRLADGVIANSSATLDTVPSARRGSRSWVIPASVEIPPGARAHGPGPATFGTSSCAPSRPRSRAAGSAPCSWAARCSARRASKTSCTGSRRTSASPSESSSAASARTSGPSSPASTCSCTRRSSPSRSGPSCSRAWPPGWRSSRPTRAAPPTWSTTVTRGGCSPVATRPP